MSVSRSASVLALASLAVALPAFAQVNGTYIPTANGNYSDTARWVGGVIPGLGGTATFPEANANYTLTLGSSTPTLGTVAYSSAFSQLITNVGTGGIVLPASGGNFAIAKSETATPLYRSLGLQIFAPISGGPLVKSGPGAMTILNDFSTANSFSGGVQILGGVLEVQTGNGGLSTSGNTVTLDNGGTLRARVTNLVSGAGRNIVLGNGGGVVDASESNRSISFAGTLTGPGNLTKTGLGTFIQDFTGAMTGSVTIRNGQFAMAGRSGIMTNVPTFDVATTLILDNSRVSAVITTNANNRVGDAATVRLRGGELLLRGHNVTNTYETVGTLALQHGNSFASVVPNAAASATVAFATLNRPERGSVMFRATGLGNTPAPGVGSIEVTNFASGGLVGGGGGPGSTNQSILPYALGNIIVDPNNIFSGANFVTRDAASNRIRPLTATEYSSSLLGITTDNVKLVSGGLLTGSATHNSLFLAGGTLSGIGTLSLTSGSVFTNLPSTIAVPLAFGPAEGVLLLAGATDLTSPISGTNGITKLLAGSFNISGGANFSTYSGTTTLAGGRTSYEGDLPVSANSAFGNSATPIVLTAGRDSGIPEIPLVTRLWAGTNSTISRDLLVAGNGIGKVYIGTVNGTEAVTINGGITLERQLGLEFGDDDFTTLDTPGIINGVISGPGSIADVPANFGEAHLFGSNTYSGGTFLTSGTFAAGHDNAFGTGPITAESYTSGTNTFVGTILSAPGTGSRVFPNAIILADGLEFSGNDDLTFTGDVDLTGFSPVVFVNNTVTTLAGNVRDGRLRKFGPGPLILSGNNTFLGGIEIGEGEVRIGNGGTTGTLPGNASTADDTTLTFDRSDTYIYPGRISGTGDLRQAGAGTTVLTQNNNYRSSFIDAGTLQVGNGGTTGTLGGFTVFNNGTLVFARSNTYSPGNNINGSGNVHHTGSGTLNLNGILTYQGNTRVLGGGTLNINQALTTPAGTLQVLSGVANISAPHNGTGGPVALSAQIADISIGSTGQLFFPAIDLASSSRNLIQSGPVVIAAGGLLQLGNNDLVSVGGNLLNLTNAARQFVLTGTTGFGYAAFPGDTRAPFAALGVRSASRSGVAEFDTFDNVPVSPTDILAKYTYLGDTNLDGTLDASDFNAVLNGYTNALSGWENGDINYDGVVTASDFSAFLTAYTHVLGGGLPFGASTAPAGAIPEPAALALFVPAALLFRRRR
jgi:fibronectin-binding autotransporter adhesin